ncbi:MAG: NMD3-related protein [Thermoplasmata archaeon]
MFCVECGKEPNELYEGLCEECYLKDADVAVPFSLDIEICTSCGAVKDGHRWIERPDMNSIMLQRIDESIEPSHIVDAYSFLADFTEEDQRNIHVDLEVELISNGLTKRTNKETKIRFKNGQCTICSRIHGHYYEAIIQVRPTKKSMTEEQKQVVREVIDKEVRVKRGDERSIFITSTEEKHGGLDFYMSDNGVSKKLSKRLAEIFGGEVTTSSKLAGRDDGKNIYKVTYSVRIPPYERGDFVYLVDKIYRIKEIRTSSGHLTLREMSSGKTVTLDKRDAEDIKMIGDEDIIREAVIVSEEEHEIKILDPDDYNTKTLVKPQGYVTDKDTARIIKYMGRILLIPDNNI